MENSTKRNNQGFTLVELVTVIVILGVLSAVTASRFVPQNPLQLQACRDQLIAAFFVAQQKAMSQDKLVQLTTSGNRIDIRVDHNEDGVFSASESVTLAAQVYPLGVGNGIVLSTTDFVFDRLGHTTPGTVSITKEENSATVSVSGTGYAYY